MRYLIDTNTCINILRKDFNYIEVLRKITTEDCYISEITLFELKVGDCFTRLHKKNYNEQDFQRFIDLFKVMPIRDAIDFAAEEKVRLRLKGTPIGDDFDLFIGCTAVKNNMTIVTENVKRFKNIQGIKIVNWVNR